MFLAVTIFPQLFGTEGKWLIEIESKCHLIPYMTESSAITGERYHLLGKHHQQSLIPPKRPGKL